MFQRCAPWGGTMSRRKQTTPNKVHWEQVFAGLEEHTRQAMMRRGFPGLLGAQAPLTHQPLLLLPPEKDSSSCDSDGEGETTQDEVSSHASEDDGTMAVAVKKELEPPEQLGSSQQVTRDHEVGLNASPDALMGLSQCPLCQLECGSREQLVTHVYQKRQLFHGLALASPHRDS
ncbi:zinc finger protein 821 isoform X7 [Rhineura floridana]|uniref:zinc finger protein 821 isoform X7 n=1 Tax=Rhineura floridana TaxID=261503 RepID=UPI002AC87754|nr:zinc finger protein 821 isoform X7 [Rhineura floridana]